MDAFQFGRMVKQAMFKRAYTPDATYPDLPSPSSQPEYAPTTPPQLFRGQNVEADIPPRMFPRAVPGQPVPPTLMREPRDRDFADAYPDVDNVFGVQARQQVGQGLLRTTNDITPQQYAKNMQTVQNQNAGLRRSMGLGGSSSPAPVLPQGTGAAPKFPAPPRGTGMGALKR